MNILCLNYEYPPLGGGGGVVNHWLARELVSQGVKVSVITSLFRGTEFFEDRDGVKVYRVPVMFRYRRRQANYSSMFTYIISSFFFGYRLLLRKARFELINSHFAIPTGVSGVLLAKLFKLPHLLSLHGGDIYDPTRKLSPYKFIPFNKLVTFILNHSQKVITHSSDIKEKLYQYYSFHTPVSVIPLGLPKVSFLKATREEYRYQASDFILISISRLIPRKNYLTLLEVLKKLASDKIKLILIGDGPEREKLRRKAASLGILSQVSFRGEVSEEEKYRLLSLSDVFILLSFHEGFGLIFLEAMRVGLPIIATREGGPRDFIKEGENGFLVSPTNFREIIAKLKLLVNSPSLRAKMRENNLRKAPQFTISRVAEAYHKEFKKCLLKFR
jgi:glycosyltransferase involved in cell wall biosynthesis